MAIQGWVAGALGLMAMACSPQAAVPQQADVTNGVAGTATPDRHAVSGLEVIPLTVNTGETTHRFQVEVARTPEQQQRGLMYREGLGPFEGMIFPYNPPAVQGFWMKNVPIPLDIIFVGPDGRIINIAANTPPMSEQSVYSEGPASLVFEIAGGRAAQLGIEPGDRVEW